MTPDQYTNKELFIDVGDGHQLYVHDWGNKKAKTPVVFLHGGPGDGCGDKHKNIFDPEQHRVIFFDQRGAGRSLPYGSLENNTTDKLVEDIEIIARHFTLKTLVLCGGSWGSTLAFAYALAHPKRVASMVLNGIFTGTRSEIDYFDKGAFRSHYPEAWQQYLDATPKNHHESPTQYHYKRALGKDERAARESARVYENLERALLPLDDRASFVEANDPAYDPSGIRIGIHYMTNYCFMPDNYIFTNARKLTMPIWMVQGRYDMVCPPVTAYELQQKLPNSKLLWTIAGHRGSERETYSVVRAILSQFS